MPSPVNRPNMWILIVTCSVMHPNPIVTIQAKLGHIKPAVQLFYVGIGVGCIEQLFLVGNVRCDGDFPGLCLLADRSLHRRH